MSVKGVVYVHEAYEAKNKNLLCEHITPTKFLYIYIYSTPIVAYAHTMFVTFCAMNVPASASCARPSILGTRVRSQGGIVSMFGHYMQGAGKLPLGAGCCQADPCPSNASIVRRAAAASSPSSAGCTPPRGPPSRLLCRIARKAVATWIELE